MSITFKAIVTCVADISHRPLVATNGPLHSRCYQWAKPQIHSSVQEGVDDVRIGSRKSCNVHDAPHPFLSNKPFNGLPQDAVFRVRIEPRELNHVLHEAPSYLLSVTEGQLGATHPLNDSGERPY